MKVSKRNDRLHAIRRSRAREAARILRARRIRRALEDLDMDINLDEILDEDVEELSEDEFEPVECPVGCVPEEEKEEEREEEKKEEEAEEAEEKEESEEEEKEEVEASVSDVSEEQGETSDTTEDVVTATNAEEDVTTTDRVATIVPKTALSDVDPNTINLVLHNTDKPHYVIMASGHPVGEIHLEDMDIPEDMQDLFASDQFTNGLLDSIQHFGVSAALHDMPVRYYEDAVSVPQAEDRGRKAALQDLEEAYQRKVAAIKDEMFNKVHLAFEASLKNVLLSNPLRDAFRQAATAYGMTDSAAVEVFEQAMQTAGADYFASLFQKADEWLGFQPEAMQQIEATIREAEYSHPVDRGLEVAEEEVQPERVASIPRTMMPKQAPQAEKTAAVNGEEILRNYLRGIGFRK